MKIILLACIALLLPTCLLPACSSLGSQGMSAEQLTAAAKDKSVSVNCVTTTGVWGTATLVNANMDKSVIDVGGLDVSDGCKSIKVNTSKLPKEAATVVPVPAK